MSDYIKHNRSTDKAAALSSTADQNTIFFTKDTQELIMGGKLFGPKNISPTIDLNTMIPVTNSTVKVSDVKSAVVNSLEGTSTGIGANIIVPAVAISKWNTDDEVVTKSSVYSMMKLSGGYASNTYGQYLLSTFGDNDLGYVGINGSEWTPLRWILSTKHLKQQDKSILAAATITSVSGRQYAVQKDAGGCLSVNVPWTDTSGLLTTYTLTEKDPNSVPSTEYCNVYNFSDPSTWPGYMPEKKYGRVLQFPTPNGYLTGQMFWTVERENDNSTTGNLYWRVGDPGKNSSAWSATQWKQVAWKSDVDKQISDTLGNLGDLNFVSKGGDTMTGTLNFNLSDKAALLSIQATTPILEFDFKDGGIYLGTTASTPVTVTELKSYNSIEASAFYETSDLRKKDIKSDLSLDKCYDLIDKCQTVIYSLKDQTKEQVGLIAQEIEEFFPEVVATDNDGFKSLDYSRLVVICFKVLKDIIKRLEKLEHE